jgi:hypothetical protein
MRQPCKPLLLIVHCLSIHSLPPSSEIICKWWRLVLKILARIMACTCGMRVEPPIKTPPAHPSCQCRCRACTFQLGSWTSGIIHVELLEVSAGQRPLEASAIREGIDSDSCLWDDVRVKMGAIATKGPSCQCHCPACTFQRSPWRSGFSLHLASSYVMELAPNKGLNVCTAPASLE